MADYSWMQSRRPWHYPAGQTYLAGTQGMNGGFYFQGDPNPYARFSNQMGLNGDTVIRQPQGYFPGCSLGDRTGRWGYHPGFNGNIWAGAGGDAAFADRQLGRNSMGILRGNMGWRQHTYQL